MTSLTKNQAWLSKVIVFWFCINLFDSFVSSPILNYLFPSQRSDLLLEILFKVLELILGISLNYWIMKQPVFWTFKLTHHTSIFIVLLGIISLLISLTAPQHVFSGLTVGLIAAVPEEYLFRGIILSCLMRIKFANSLKLRVLIAIVLSAILFSLYHFGNIKSQSLMATIEQMIEVFGLGILLGVLYIRKGSLLIPMMVHFSLDYGVTVKEGLTSSPSNGSIGLSLIHSGIYILLAIPFLNWQKPHSWQLLYKLSLNKKT